MQNYPKGSIEHFIEITNYFTGLKAVLFSYNPGFRTLYVGVQKQTRYFLMRYMEVKYVQTSTDWIFNRLNTSYVKGKNGGYKFFDQDCFEVMCHSPLVIELLNYQEVIGTEPLLRKISITSHLDFVYEKDLSEAYLINNLPLLKRGTAYPFRYDRWNKVFFLEIVTILNRRFYLACYDCRILRFPQSIPVEQLKLLKEAEDLVLVEESHDFLIRFTSIKLYSEAEMGSYIVERFKKFSDREQFGIKKSILSVNDL